jgi:asparagine synthase (glutamine-hydrolysing)
MQKALNHRGPDDRGIFIAQDHQVALAHAGHQPMSIDNGRYWITFNGEIYNFQELRSHLESQGEQFASQTDTEVLLKTYQYYGQDCVRHLRGMFALAIWDDLEKTCFLARDHLGIKPLYYWQSGSTLVFASELKAILASGLPSINLSSAGVYGYLTTGTVPEPYTLIENINCLEAGHCLFWQGGQLSKQSYWQIQFRSEAITLPKAQEIVRNALIDSVKHHFISDVPVGIFLSGGIDSTAILALARQTQTNQLRTYSIAFADPEFNEGNLASKTAQHFATEHTEYQLDATIGQSLFTKYLKHIDQPTIDGFNTFCISQIAQQNGTKVVLSGLGGDELFGGYNSFQKIPQMVSWANRLAIFSPVMEYGSQYLVASDRPHLKRIGDFLQQPPSSFNAYRSFRGIFSHQEAWQIAHSLFPDDNFQLNYLPSSIPSQPSLADEVSFLELSRYMRNQLLRDSDVMSMAWGLELRVPFVDKTLLETIASIPSLIRLLPQKQLLTQSVPTHLGY